MEHDDIHELTAAYALDALDASDERRYEDHLATCARCREELATLAETATALAYGVDVPPPAPELRERILAGARAQQSNVIPIRRRLPYALGVLAAVAASVAIAVAVWANGVAADLEQEREVARVLGDPAARSVELTGARGRLVVARDGRAVLVVAGLPPAPAGKDYEVWLTADGAPVPAGLFDRPGVVRVDGRVPEGTTVAVTLEAEGGVDAPTTSPLISATL